MMLRWIALVTLTAPFAPAETKPEIRELVRRSLAGLNKEDQKLNEYGYIRRWSRTEFQSDGSVHKKESGAWRRERRDGFWIGQVIERDGKPLPAAEAAAQEDRVRRSIEEAKRETEADRERRRRAQRKSASSEEQAWMQEFPEALDYKAIGEEIVNGRPAVVLEISPRPGYTPKNMRARVFEKMRGKLWVDKADGEMARADAEVFDTVNIGFGLLGRVEKGTRFFLERRKIAPDFWVIADQGMKFDARIMLVKTIKQEGRIQRAEFRTRAELERAAAIVPARAKN